MRLSLPLLALAALGLSSPASADITARYGGTGKYAPTMNFAVDESGQVRAEAGPPNNPRERVVLIRREGVDYVSAADAQGRFVARTGDLFAIADEMIRNSMPENARAGMRALADIRLEIVEGGMETVGGRQGRLYRITMAAPQPGPRPAAAQAGEDAEDQNEPAQMPPLEIVISDDPELAPVGREMARLFDSANGLVDAVMGTRPAVAGQIRDLLARGTLIRINGEFRLRSVSTDAVPDSAFALPGPVLTRAELRARAPQPPPRADADAD
jgi:hypothetical protein